MKAMSQAINPKPNRKLSLRKSKPGSEVIMENLILYCENKRYVLERRFNACGRLRTTYTIRYIVRTDFPAQITRNDTQYVQIFPYKLHDTIHCTYGSLEVPEGSCMNNTIRTDSQCSYANGFSFKLYFLLLQNKISLQSVESLNRTFFSSPCSFSVILRSNQWYKGVVSLFKSRRYLK